MTLIVGTTHWNGICLNSDTRVTNRKTGIYLDNAQKISHVHGGIGMAASGDRQSAILLRETIRNRLDEFAKANIKFDSSIDLAEIIKDLLISALKKTREHKLHKTRAIYKTQSRGLIGVSISDQKLHINQTESKNLLSIIHNGSYGLKIDDLFLKKYITYLMKCSEGHIPFVKFDEYPQNVLYKYDLKLYDDESFDIYRLEKVPFGEIEALGSGSEFDYSSKRDRVLFFTLFNGDFKDVATGSLHLSMIHEFAESLAPKDKVFNIKTFGGAIVPGIISTLPNGDGITGIIECDLGSKIVGTIVSKTYRRGKDLWVTTRSGDEIKLEPFPNQIDIVPGMFW